MFSIKWLSLFLISMTTFPINATRVRRSPILGGKEARKNQFPYAVAIVSVDKAIYTCTGGIVNSKYILSAAHCFTNEDNSSLTDEYAVLAGTIDMDLTYVDSETRIVNVLTILIPEDFDFKKRQSDISLVKLADDLMIEKYHLQALTIPVSCEKNYIGTQAVAAAFGACEIQVSKNGTEKIVDDYDIDGKLRYADIEIINKAQCHDVPYGNFSIEDYHLLGKMLKNSSEVYGMCYGDSGSPLVYKSSIVIGVMVDAFDIGCDGRTVPTIFTKVCSYTDVIRNASKGYFNNDILVRPYE